MSEQNTIKKGSVIKEITDYIEIFVFAICFVMIMFSFVFRVCTVKGDSMIDTLHENENLIVSDLFYTPKQGDIIVFHDTDTLNEPVVKRVIATEGEKVDISYTGSTMTVTVTAIDGSVRVLEEPYITYEYQKYFDTPSYTVPEDHVFVMGDNRNNSFDSRDANMGYIETNKILGRVIFRITPFSKAGFVK